MPYLYGTLTFTLDDAALERFGKKRESLLSGVGAGKILFILNGLK